MPTADTDSTSGSPVSSKIDFGPWANKSPLMAAMGPIPPAQEPPGELTFGDATPTYNELKEFTVSGDGNDYRDVLATITKVTHL